MNALDRLIAIEDIRQLKARYFYAYDHKDWEMWRNEVWAPEGRLEIPELDFAIGPREDMIAWVMAQSAGQTSVHHGHTSTIDITSAVTATGIWAMEDRLWRTGENPAHGQVKEIHGFGHYHESYVKREEGWRIASARLTRLRVEEIALRSS